MAITLSYCSCLVTEYCIIWGDCLGFVLPLMMRCFWYNLHNLRGLLFQWGLSSKMKIVEAVLLAQIAAGPC